MTPFNIFYLLNIFIEYYLGLKLIASYNKTKVTFFIRTFFFLSILKVAVMLTREGHDALDTGSNMQ